MTAPRRGRSLRFEGTVSLGQLVLLLPLLTLVGTGVNSIWRVSGEYQATRDAIAHETEIRQQAITGLASEVHALQGAIADLRSDVRALDQRRR